MTSELKTLWTRSIPSFALKMHNRITKSVSVGAVPLPKYRSKILIEPDSISVFKFLALW